MWSVGRLGQGGLLYSHSTLCKYKMYFSPSFHIYIFKRTVKCSLSTFGRRGSGSGHGYSGEPPGLH